MNIDIAIVLIYLGVTLAVGIYYGRGVKTVQDYAIGDRNFSTPVLVMTIAATWISGSNTLIHVQEGFENGFMFAFSRSGLLIATLFIAYVIAPRFDKFLGMSSLGEIMKKSYGSFAQNLTGLAAYLYCFGLLALQIKAMGILFNTFSTLDIYVATYLSAGVITTYSAFGGIKSVTFTDVLQFFTFVVALPILYNICLSASGGYGSIQSLSLYDFFSLNQFQEKGYLLLFFFYLVPGFNPAIVQRMLMAKNVGQIKQSFKYTALIWVPYTIITIVIGIIGFKINPGFDPSQILYSLINSYAGAGLKAIIIIGMLAIIMSTADSYLNASTVAVINDSGIFTPKRESNLVFFRIFTVFTGFAATVLALSVNRFLDLIISIEIFYAPLIAIPLLMCVMGFNLSQRNYIKFSVTNVVVILIGGYYQYFGLSNIQFNLAISGFAFLLIITLHISENKSSFTNMCGHFIGTIFGVVKIKVQNLNADIINKKNIVKNFNLNIHIKQTHPHLEKYIGVSQFIILTNFFTATILLDIRLSNLTLVFLLLAGLISTITQYHDALPKMIKEYLPTIWMINLLFSASFINTWMIFITNSSALSTVICVLGYLMLIILVNWKFYLVANFSSIVFAMFFHQLICMEQCYEIAVTSISYSFYITTFATLVGFMIARPKQEAEKEVSRLNFKLGIANEQLTDANFVLARLNEFMEIKEAELLRVNGHLDESVRKLRELRSDILAKISHEIRIPMNGLFNFTEMLRDHGMLSADRQKEAVEMAYYNAKRLQSYVFNLVDLAAYEQNKLLMKFEKVNICKLVESVIEEQKLVISKQAAVVAKASQSLSLLERKKLEAQDMIEGMIEGKIEGKINEVVTKKASKVKISLNTAKGHAKYIDADKYRIRQLLENLISNSVKYGAENIWLELKSPVAGEIQMTCADDGIGILESERIKIYEPFYTGISCTTKAEGRGLGLSLVKAIAQLHHGKITVSENNAVAKNNKENKGSIFTLTIPTVHETDFISAIDSIKAQRARRSILIVDDNEMVVKTTKNLLESMGYKVYAAVCGKDAVQQINAKKFNIDVLFLDLLMPDLKGEDVLEKTAKVIETTDIKVIIQSGTTQQHLLDVKNKYKMVIAALAKPFNREQLETTLDSVLGIN